MQAEYLRESLDSVLSSGAKNGVEGPRPTPTGLTDLDGLIGGLRAGDLWVVTGRSGAGKSVLALDFVRAAAVRHGARTGHVRARDRLVDLLAQLVSAEGRVPLHHLRTTLTDNERTRATAATAVLADAPLWLTASVEYGEVRLPEAHEQVAAAQALLDERGLELLIVDDLPASVSSAHLQELKGLAVRRRTCVVAVVLEGPERTRDDVERDAAVAADVVLRVDRDHERPPGTDSVRAGEADLLVLRHRRGPVAAVTVAFQGHYARFVNLTFG